MLWLYELPAELAKGLCGVTQEFAFFLSLKDLFIANEGKVR